MRLLHLNAGNLYGGIETMLVTLARFRGDAPGLEQRFALCFPARLAEELSAAGTPVEILGPARASRPWTVWRARRALRALLAREPFDAVACHGSWSLGLFGPVVRTTGARLVLWAHSPGRGPAWLERLADQARPDLVVANSRFTAEGVRGRFPGATLEVLHPPVAPPPPLNPREREAMRASLGARPEDVVILAASRLERWKGLHLLMEALVRLRGEPHWACWIAGGARRDAERQYLADLEQACQLGGIADRVHFLGERRDVRALMAAADVFCQANLEPEPFGISFVEALFAGLPVVTTAMGGALEVVDGATGMLVAPDSNSLGQAIASLVRDAEQRQRLGSAGPERAAALSSPPGAARRVAHFLGEPAGQSASVLRPAPLWVRAAAFAVRRLPAGRYRLTHRWRNSTAPFVATLGPEAGSFRFCCDLRDSVAREACFTGRYEPQETAVLRAVLAPGDTFVDVGANWGYFTLLAAHLVGKTGRIVSLEPDPRVYSLLRANVRLNGLHRTEAMQMAASSEAGTLTLAGHDAAAGNWGVSRLVDAAAPGQLAFQVEAVRVDDLLDRMRIGSVDLVKMDIEGAESLAFLGMSEGLRRHRYRRLLVELHPDALRTRGTRPEDLCSWIEGFGYRGYSVDHSRSATRRAAYRRQPDVSRFLLPFRPGDLLRDWPHILWTAPTASNVDAQPRAGF